MSETINMKVTKAGYKYIGHCRTGYLEIALEGSHCGASIFLTDAYKLYDLFRCFEVNPEDGKWLHDLEGKYCRVTFDEDGSVRMVEHLTNSNIWWSEKC